MIKDRHTFIAVLFVILFGGVLFFQGTDGFQAFTAETARTNELQQSKPVLPAVTLEDSRERVYSFGELAENKLVFITFMYTSCGSVCPQLEMNMAEVYQAVPKEKLGKDIVFLSLSFDPENDDPQTLAKYETYFGSDGDTWRMARINDKQEQDALLEKLGVIVIPDGYGNFQHNSAFYIINDNGSLEEIMDFTEIEEAADKVITLLDEKEEEEK